jgi:hypothetical protein|tara:strand:+ start:1707 stop:1850 length:144 start_codon:yes stop_codon:yes gene_type:complete
MPIVDGKHYPYTPEGIARAKKAKKKKKKTGFSWDIHPVKGVKGIYTY